MGHIQARVECWASAGARHGIEYRYPMLDRPLLEFALRTPPFHLRNGHWNRWIARQAAARDLPDAVAWDPIKRESNTYETSDASRRRMLGRLARRLRTSPPPGRSEYVDIPALLRAIEADDSAAIVAARQANGPIRVLDLGDLDQVVPESQSRSSSA